MTSEGESADLYSYLLILIFRSFNVQHWSSSFMLCLTQWTSTCCILMQQNPDSPSGLTPLTFLSQPHLSSSPRVHARVTATATAAEDKACTKAASRVPESKIYHTMQEINLKFIWELLSVWIFQQVAMKFANRRTLVHYSAKYIDSTCGGGTVPATIPELVLALR